MVVETRAHQVCFNCSLHGEQAYIIMWNHIYDCNNSKNNEIKLVLKWFCNISKVQMKWLNI